MRLIDADKIGLTDFEILLCDGSYKKALEALCSKIEGQPTVDAVEVVRCKDCRWGREVCGNIECFVDSNMPSEYHGYEWFCPNGERRSE